MNIHKPVVVLAALCAVTIGLLYTAPADAIQRGARTGINHAHAGGGGARAANVNRPANAGHAANANRGHAANVDHNRDVNRNVNRDVNRNVNRDVHRDIDVDVDVDNHWHDGWYDHPVATAAAVTTAAVVTSAVIGSIVYSVPPSCVTSVINGIAYQQCGNTWYQPQYAGTTVQYIVVNPPG